MGDDPGAIAAIWLKGINTIWNTKAFFSDGHRLYEVKLKATFVDSGADQIVTVHDKAGRDDMSNWYLKQPGWGPGKLDEIAAHETGHMLGNFDEYKGGATFGGFTTTNTLMSDLTVRNIPAYFWGVEFYAEQLSGLTLDTVAARTGTARDDTAAGGKGMDGFYGLAGDDTISGLGGNDYIDGGSGGDSLSGGTGRDILKGQAGNDFLDGGLDRDTLWGGARDDSFVFGTRLTPSGIDRIADFTVGSDELWLDRSVFTKLVAVDVVTSLHQGGLAASVFVSGTKALDAKDRIIFDPATGRLSYDADGTGAAEVQVIAVLSHVTGTIDAGDFVIFNV